jgi:phosphoenolpyruvate carboxylase
MLTAGVTNHFKNNKSSLIHAENRALIEQLSDLSFKKYDKLKKHEMFIPYLEIMSTLKYYSSTNIGSRPGKRGSAKQLTLDDLRAISFVGSWSQLKQNVPGYFGIGTALQSLKNEGRMDEMKKLFNEVPFFKALMLNSMMSLSKSYFPLTAYMKDNSDFKEFWQILYDEYEMTKQMLLEVSGYERLMQEEPISSKSIKIREKIVLPLLTIQQYALQKIAAGDPQSEIYKKIVVRSLYGNINASRNSA